MTLDCNFCGKENIFDGHIVDIIQDDGTMTNGLDGDWEHEAGECEDCGKIYCGSCGKYGLCNKCKSELTKAAQNAKRKIEAIKNFDRCLYPLIRQLNSENNLITREMFIIQYGKAQRITKHESA